MCKKGRLPRFGGGILHKIVAVFVVLFSIMLFSIVIQTVTSFSQATEYDNIISNIDEANQLNTIVQADIVPLVGGVVAGRVAFEQSGLQTIIEDVRARMNSIMNSTYSAENSATMAVALRTLITLENYVNRLGEQIAARGPVAENMAVWEEIEGVVALMTDFIQSFISRQLVQVAVMNTEMAARGNAHFYLNLVLIFTALLVGVASFLYISKSIMSPIEKLCVMSREIAEGRFSSKPKLFASEEFNLLADSMHAMAGEIEQLIEKNKREQQNLQRSEMRALQAQITPHFLYNALDAIIWAAEANNKEDVVRLVSSLSAFFRISLSHGIDFITVSEEIAHVRSYLAIQKIRYRDVLSYEIDLAPGLGDKKILKLLLQPLVENAIYHGIKNTRERGLVRVAVQKTAEGVLFLVTDTGVGIEPARLLALRAALSEAADAPATKGYGLFNVNKRLRLYYNLSEGIRIRSDYHAGTAVSFVLPL